MTNWEGIVAEHAGAVWRTAYRLVSNAADADDCMQEAFTSAVEISRREVVRSWPALLHRLVTTRSLDRLRRRMREAARRDRPADLAKLPGGEPDPQRQAAGRELAGQLRHGLARLPAQQAEAFCLRFLSDMSYDEIAGQIGVSSNYVGVILHRARLRLRTLLADVAAAENLRCQP